MPLETSTPATPDIEIYIKGAKLPAVLQWLEQLGTRMKISEQSQARVRGSIETAAIEIPFLLVPEAVKGFASLWFDSPDTPWPNDLVCARAVTTALGCETRCAVTSWAEDENPEDEKWWKITPEGEGQIRWHL